ncbi:MAG TPA: MOSC N-terminal beta barrel domain-containing protein [Chloroflexia bacterium]|nr:MOSC N-terminal beta barrel domain-containing protein [Chloroflexia bacterium]
MQLVDPAPDLKERLEQASLVDLYYYPVKSCAGQRLEQAQVVETGLLHDRELMVVDATNAEFLTQRELPRMALIKPQISGSHLTLNAPGMPALEMDLLLDGPEKGAKVWDDSCRTIDQGDEIARWFSEFLQYEARLVRMSPRFKRTLDSRYALSPDDTTNFADGFPFLLISQESLDDLNSRMAEALPMNRFRPNLVIAGSGIPFGEDQVRRIQIGEISFSIVKPCARCVTTTTDQQTAERGKEPLRTLATYRKAPKGVMFGQNLIHSGTGVLRVGDPVRVVEWPGK